MTGAPGTMDTEDEHAREVLVAQLAGGERLLLLPNGTYRQVAGQWLLLPDGTTRAMTEAECSGAKPLPAGALAVPPPEPGRYVIERSGGEASAEGA